MKSRKRSECLQRHPPDGLTLEEIADELGVSVTTVRDNINSALNKIGLKLMARQIRLDDLVEDRDSDKFIY